MSELKDEQKQMLEQIAQHDSNSHSVHKPVYAGFIKPPDLGDGGKDSEPTSSNELTSQATTNPERNNHQHGSNSHSDGGLIYAGFTKPRDESHTATEEHNYLQSDNLPTTSSDRDLNHIPQGNLPVSTEGQGSNGELEEQVKQQAKEAAHLYAQDTITKGKHADIEGKAAEQQPAVRTETQNVGTSLIEQQSEGAKRLEQKPAEPTHVKQLSKANTRIEAQNTTNEQQLKAEIVDINAQDARTEPTKKRVKEAAQVDTHEANTTRVDQQKSEISRVEPHRTENADMHTQDTTRTLTYKTETADRDEQQQASDIARAEQQSETLTSAETTDADPHPHGSESEDKERRPDTNLPKSRVKVPTGLAKDGSDELDPTTTTKYEATVSSERMLFEKMRDKVSGIRDQVVFGMATLAVTANLAGGIEIAMHPPEFTGSTPYSQPVYKSPDKHEKEPERPEDTDDQWGDAVEAATKYEDRQRKREQSEFQAATGAGQPSEVPPEPPELPGSSWPPENDWWRASDLGPYYDGTRVPRNFNLEVGGKRYYVHPNATEHFAEFVKGRMTKGISSSGEHPISVLAGAVEKAQALGLVAGRNEINIGNWELGIDTNNNTIFHFLPKKYDIDEKPKQ